MHYMVVELLSVNCRHWQIKIQEMRNSFSEASILLLYKQSSVDDFPKSHFFSFSILFTFSVQQICLSLPSIYEKNRYHKTRSALHSLRIREYLRRGMHNLFVEGSDRRQFKKKQKTTENRKWIERFDFMHV